jgi:hypothetical protein
MPLAKHQIRVKHLGHLTHSSGTPEYRTAIARARKEALKAGPGAIATVYQFTSRDRVEMVPVYEARVARVGKRGTPRLVTELPPMMPREAHHEEPPA